MRLSRACPLGPLGPLGLVVLVGLVVICLVSGPLARQGSAQTSPEPAISAAGAILADSSDGRILYARRSHERREIASTTKLVTALVVVEHSDPGTIVTVRPEATLVGKGDPQIPRLGLKVGEMLPERELVYSMLLDSDVDAAVALAQQVGGTVGSFVAMMNAKASEIGAADTHFANPDGLDDPAHYSTPYDLMLFARQAMKDSFLRQVVRTQEHSIVRGAGVTTVVKNRNLLLGTYPGADGIKTGHTLVAGRALIASARRGQEARIAVVLGSSDPFRDAAALLDHGFNDFRRVWVTRAGEPWGTMTFGDGTTWGLVGVSDASLLVGRSEADPQISFDRRRRQVMALAPGSEPLRAALVPRCGRHRCPPPGGASGAVGWVISALLWLVSPLAHLAAAAR